MHGYQKAITPHVSGEVRMSCCVFDIISFHQKQMNTADTESEIAQQQVVTLK